MIKLMNSAMMPELTGVYQSTQITHAQFCEDVTTAYACEQLQSYIGYEQNAALIKEWTGIDIEVNRETATLENGDWLLVMKLKYRPDIKDKGKLVDPNDFEFSVVYFTETADKDFRVGDIVCVPGDGSVRPFPTGYISKIEKDRVMVVFGIPGGTLAQPYSPAELEHREVESGEPIRPSEYRELTDGTAVKIKVFEKRLSVYVETDVSIRIDGEIKSIKPHIFIDETELLAFVKARAAEYADDENEWKDVSEIRLLKADVEHKIPKLPPGRVEKLIDFTA